MTTQPGASPAASPGDIPTGDLPSGGEVPIGTLPFGAVAAEYDRIRPGYPAELVDAVLARAFPDGRPYGPALEAGAGTGLGTQALAGRGVEVTAYEPDPQMAARARLRCAGLPVRVVEARFEDALPDGVPLLFSAQAWHWIDPAVRWDVAARLLSTGGMIALFWNHDRIADPGVQARVDEAYAAIAPINVWSIAPQDEAALPGEWPAVELRAHTAFTGVTTTMFRWERMLSRADYLAYLASHSPFLRLDDATRRRLLDAIAGAVGDDVRLAEDTSLYLATRV